MASQTVLRLVLVVAGAFPAAAQTSVLLDAMSQELNRNFTVLKEKAENPPYYMSYEVTERESRAFAGTLGTVEPLSQGKSRTLDVSVRVGSPKMDNYHRTRGQGGGAQGQFTSGSALTFEDSANAIKRLLWLDTDRAYRMAAERFVRIQTSTQVRVAEADDSDDFSSEPPSVMVEKPVELKFDEAVWRERIRRLSARFKDYPAVLTSHVGVSVQTDTRYLVNTEGSRLRHGRGFAGLVITASAKAGDGTDLGTYETFQAADVAGLPDEKALMARTTAEGSRPMISRVASIPSRTGMTMSISTRSGLARR